jgi:hypothetical protein
MNWPTSESPRFPGNGSNQGDEGGRPVLKDAVMRDVRKRLQERKGTPEWLNSGVEFSHALRLSDDLLPAASSLLQSFGIAGRRENAISFEVLIANLLRHKGRWPIIVGLSPNWWKKTRYSQAGISTIAMIKALHKGGFIGMKKGFHVEKESRLTRIWATEKLLQYFPELPNGVVEAPPELVELRDENDRLKDYRDTQRTKRIRALLERANEVNSQADIRYLGYKLSGSLVAIFRQKFTLYGRLHTRGYRHYQGLSEDERAEITINGDPVVELDYSGLHPNLLYANEGRQFFGDPYSIVDDRPEVRPFLKSILLFMLNAADDITAERAANYWLYKHDEEREALRKLGITRARPLMDGLKEKHKPIAHYFCAGNENGLRVMNLDATIALDVIDHFTQKGIPILAIHDSFVVQQQYRDELYTTMKAVYRHHTGFRIAVK